MNKSFLIKDTIIIFFIILVFIAVILVFYTEIIKKNNVNTAKKNFYFVKNQILEEIKNCKEINRSLIFGDSCEKNLSKEIITIYFNKTKKLINPYNGGEAVNENPGSVLIDIKNKILLLSIDVDANGGIDIEQSIGIE